MQRWATFPDARKTRTDWRALAGSPTKISLRCAQAVHDGGTSKELLEKRRARSNFEIRKTEMRSNQKAAKNIDEYIAGFPNDVQAILQKIRNTIRRAAPKAEEAIKYHMPTFTLNGNLVHFGAFKKHIGFYPAPRGVEMFKKELSAYEGAKSSLRFPLDRPIPFDLISRIVKFRVKKNLESRLK
jgi:uncharacterized protein YdhG (YjbR/CyaY superfamily)